LQGQVVVIGYGSTLRTDDAVGPRAAEAVASWGRPGVVAIRVPQLTPELAEPLAAARLALFVDARAEHIGEGVSVLPIEPSDPGPAMGHASDPRCLLALALAAYGAYPRAWLITVPATDLDLGEGLSAEAARGLEDALRRIAAMLDEEDVPVRPAGGPRSPRGAARRDAP
jgi:hydrogenase maturation protease